MAIQRHPVDSFNPKSDFWEEFPDYKIHPIFSRIWKTNKNKPIESSKFMWALALCYDRKSSFFSQPEQDKWEVVSEELFDDPFALLNFALYDDENKENPFNTPDEVQVIPVIDIPVDIKFRQIIVEFEKSIDTPLGMSLRELERKLVERTRFIMDTKYTLDTVEGGKLKKGTSEQLDKMFVNTDKITALISKALEALHTIEGSGVTKGGQKESLGDAGKNF